MYKEVDKVDRSFFQTPLTNAIMTILKNNLFLPGNTIVYKFKVNFCKIHENKQINIKYA